MERLVRGVVAVRVTGGNYVGWRMFGYEYDAANSDQRLVQRLSQRHPHRRRHRQHQLPGRGRHGHVDLHRASGDRRRRGRRLGVGDRLGAAVPARAAADPARRQHAGHLHADAQRGLHLHRQRRQRRRRRRRRALRDHPQVGSDQLEGQLAVGLHRRRVHRRLPPGRDAAVAHRPRAEHPRRRALHPVHGLRLRRRREGGDGGQDRARHQGRHRRRSCTPARRRTTTMRPATAPTRPATSWPAPST